MPASIRDVPIPARMRALERDARGYPIFFTIQPPPGHPVDFRAINPQKIYEVGVKRLCAICGQALDEFSWFLGGDDSFAAACFPEGPMHRACMEYAARVCPFLVNPRYEAIHRLTKQQQDYAQMNAAGTATKGEYFVKYQCVLWRIGNYAGSPVFFVDRPRQTIWYDRDWQRLASAPKRFVQHPIVPFAVLHQTMPGGTIRRVKR